MIRVSDAKQNIAAPVVLTTINCDGIERYWNADSIDEFHKWWWDENYGGPASDDPVLELVVDGNRIEGITEFEDIVIKYNFDIEVDPGTIDLEVKVG